MALINKLARHNLEPKLPMTVLSAFSLGYGSEHVYVMYTCV